jgi:hypothetical protein
VLLRWLLPIVAVCALLGNAVTAFAAAGLFGESKCCCPNPKTCKCHDHDKPRPDDHMRRCSGDAVKVAPAIQAVVIPEVLETVEEMVEQEIEYTISIESTQFVDEPVTPPF